MSAVRKTVTSALSAVLLAGGVALGVAAPANAATCPSSASPKIDGAEASWTLRCSGGTVTVSGWVEDTRMDGKCAVVRIVGGNGDTKRAQACNSGVREQFSHSFAGTNRAEARLAIA
ncbi:hypothetical protein ACFW5U_34820 [Streptomyces rochei]|uniref:Secreted protein n=2 Tax=Streptomyces rochei group TaxID=2867164 RepID=A0ABW7E582_STRRO|nr:MULTISPECIES: hypothetical protein [Streptomyces]RIH60118.1 hypothetical protein D3C59_20675 [Streptomyces sp. SHP22-7]KYK09028.1 hypothetical protein AUW26_11295 [Streptomyces sp. CC71]MBJ6619776.1 hypothetical protein [Streptomyces sp. DHE17-7]MDI3096442.1 hypothetical protein [Streptomyces sp. AN-3]QCR47741.1 hypothetical protein C1N79_14215 [Streptomyces sp. SGAir0924]